MERFAQEHGISTSQSEQALAATYGSISGSGGIKSEGSIPGELLKVTTGINIGAEGTVGKRHETSNISTGSQNQLFQDAQQFAQDNNFSQHVDDAVRATQEDSFRTSSDANSRLSDGVSSSFDQAHTYREEAASSYSQSQSYREMASQTQENSASINTNANQQFKEWMENQPAAGGTGGRMGQVAAEDMMQHDPEPANQYAENFVQQQTAARMQQWESSHRGTPQQIQSGFASHNQSIGSTADIQTRYQHDRGTVTQHREDFSTDNRALAEKADDMINKNRDTIATRRDNTRQEGAALQDTINHKNNQH